MIRTLLKKDWFHKDGFPITVERRDPQEPFGLHDHEFFEIVIITDGHGLHVTGEDSWQLSMGDVFVIGGSRPHDYHNIDQLSLINVLYDQDALALQLHDLPSLPGYHAMFRLEPAWRKRHQFRSRLRLTPKELAKTTALVDQLENELKQRDTGYGFFATAAFMQLVGYLSRCYDRSRNADSRALLRIARTITHLETNYTEPIHLDELVTMTRMSRRSFLRDFEAATGTTPISYLIHIRISHAAALLRENNLSVTQIAYQVGFNDSNYFARQFRQLMGTTPRDYRKQQNTSL
jgi:AraC-like DNA-binding protein